MPLTAVLLVGAVPTVIVVITHDTEVDTLAVITAELATRTRRGHGYWERKVCLLDSMYLSHIPHYNFKILISAYFF